MPLIGVILNPGNSGAQVGELHNQLKALGGVIAPDERNAKNFGPSTAAAVSAFRQQYGLPAGDTVDLSTGRLMHAAATFAGPRGRAALRTAVREAASVADTSQPQEIFWLARYATLAGDYQTAHDIAGRVPDHSGVRALIDPIVAPPEQPVQPDPEQPPATPQPRPPEWPYPENFYTYRRDFYPSNVINDVQDQIAAVGQPPRDPSHAYPGFPDRGASFIQTAVTWFDALKQWQIGNGELNHRRYAAAQAAYDSCQSAACDYFRKWYSINLGTGPLTERLVNLIKHIANNEDTFAPLWSKIRWRRGLLSLQELEEWDWPKPPPNVYIPRQFDPSPVEGTLPPKPDFGLGFIQQYFRRGEFGEDPAAAARQNDLEAPLITLAFVLVPLARAELNRARRQYDAAIRDLRWVLDSVLVRRTISTPENPLPQRIYARLACEFIELPFAKLLLAEITLDKADTEYKARIAADPPPAPDVAAYQGLKAAQTYLAVKTLFGNEGEYVARVDASRDELAKQVQQRLTANDTRSQAFQLLGKDILVPTIGSFGTTLPGLDRRVKAHEPLLKFTPPAGQNVMRETNPRVYAVLLTATARSEQLKAGFNYLGYLDSYLPPWRFQFLLERTRYYAEHAKNAQRDYLNFLSNAEREDLQELSASQNVEMEKSNIRIETARVDQASAELAAANESANLAKLSAENAQKRFDNYEQFDNDMRRLESTSMFGSFLSSLSSAAVTSIVNPAVGGGVLAAGFLGNLMQSGAEIGKAAAQRDLEMKNLGLAVDEANNAKLVADKQKDVADKALIVAGLQRQAALLRHEFAVQNLEFLRNRVLSAEQWYRLAAALRSISETYMRYSLELAFLAEQAYEFEADKQLNVIRFDYDISELGDSLAGDFLLRDLDTLEHDLVVTQREREQHVRYVLSMAREFPEALQELRDTGRVTFSMVLEQIERRFPGLILARLGAVDVLPLALMDQSRFSIRLTHQGFSRMRRRPAPGADPAEPWPAEPRLHAPETSIYSGLSRQDAASIFPVTTSGQRNAFEGRGAAGAWEIDMSMEENQVVPGSLADVLITFNIAGFFDADVRTEPVPLGPGVATSYISAREVFPDNFFDCSRTGKMVWPLTADLLTLSGTLGKVRNVGVLVVPARSRKQYRRYASTGLVEFTVGNDGTPIIDPDTLLPSFRFQYPDPAKPLRIGGELTAEAGTAATWDPGDGTAILEGTTFEHEYARPGVYEVTLRVVRGERLREYLSEIAVARDVLLELPLVAVPELIKEPQSPAEKRTIRAQATFPSEAGRQSPIATTWHVVEAPRARRAPDDGGASDPNEAVLDLPVEVVAGNRQLHLAFRAVRSQDVLFYSRQRYRRGPNQALHMAALNVATNRRYDGAGTQPPLNAAAKHFFGDPPAAVFSPVDAWSFEFPKPENGQQRPSPFSAPGSKPGNLVFDGAEIGDLVLTLEYEAGAA